MSSPKRPYFIRAMHEWLEDNQFTAYIIVDSKHPQLLAPTEYAQDGRLVLAISYQATHNLRIENDGISFSGRFGGVAKDVWVPMQAVMAIYAKEDSSHFLPFDPHEYENYESSDLKNHDTTKDEDGKKADKPNHLKFV